MAESNDRITYEIYVFTCLSCDSKMIFDMTFPFETDVDVYCPCTGLMEYSGNVYR